VVQARGYSLSLFAIVFVCGLGVYLLASVLLVNEIIGSGLLVWWGLLGLLLMPVWLAVTLRCRILVSCRRHAKVIYVIWLCIRCRIRLSRCVVDEQHVVCTFLNGVVLRSPRDRWRGKFIGGNGTRCTLG
jgi:hypothetical protein